MIANVMVINPSFNRIDRIELSSTLRLLIGNRINTAPVNGQGLEFPIW